MSPSAPSQKKETGKSTEKESETLYQKLQFKEVFDSSLALSSEKWLDLIQNLNLSSFAYDLTLNSCLVSCEKNQKKLIELAFDLQHENLLNKSNISELKKALKFYFANQWQVNTEEVNVQFLLCQLHCKTPEKIVLERESDEFNLKINLIKQSPQFQKLAKHFSDLKVIKVQDLQQKSDENQ